MYDLFIYFFNKKSRQMIPLHLILSGSGIQMRRSLAPQRQQVRTAPTNVALPARKVLLHAAFEGTRIV
jgi:hypothetical protein